MADNAFVFNSAPINTLDTGTYCVYPVSSVPLITDTITADVDSILGFTPVILTGRTLTDNGWIVNDFTYPFFQYTVDTVGFCVARLVGQTPSVNDKLISFHGYSNSLNQDIVTPPGSFANSFVVDDIKGLIERVPAWIYTSGNLTVASNAAATAYPNGLIYLAGTRNNTISFASPIDGVRASSWRATDGTNASELYARDTTANGGPDHILDMRESKIRVEDIHIRTNAALNNVTFWGSNLIDFGELNSGNVNSFYNDTARWTQISNSVNLPATSWNKITTTDRITFWRHLKINSANTNDSIRVIEFGRSSWQSPKENIVP